ncbi:hypothetical protein, partial [Streptomyces sp. NPDC059278]|uniref:hypothetical protein n=1 Tax=Streptomyces sp. NPDC059278 TaxID=3346801 RepID=UPI0036745818
SGPRWSPDAQASTMRSQRRTFIARYPTNRWSGRGACDWWSKMVRGARIEAIQAIDAGRG